jgi:ribosome biogenesis GTPase
MEPEISGYFLNFFKLKELCKFNNCLHKEEPKCAVKEVEKDEIAWSRYNSYLKLLEGMMKLSSTFIMRIEQLVNENRK